MKKITILLFVFVLGSTLFCQVPDITWGSVLKEHKKVNIKKIIGSDKDGTYYLKSRYKILSPSTYYIDKLDQDLKRASSHEINIAQPGLITAIEDILLRNGNIQLFISEVNKDAHTNTLYVQTVDKQSLAISSKRIKVAQINLRDNRKWNTGDFVIKTSRDDSHILIRYTPPYEKNAKEKFGFIVLNESLKNIWAKEITLPYENSEVSIISSTLDNWGNTYLLIRKRHVTVENRKNGSRWKHEILSLTNNGKRTNKYSVELKNHHVSQLQLTVNKNKDLLCAGFYSDKNGNNITGTFYMRINHETKKIEQESYKEFGLDFLTQAMTNKQKEKTKKKKEKGKNVALYNYALDEIIIKGDGGAVLIGEKYYHYTTTRTSTNSSGVTVTTTDHHYVYNDIIVVSILPNGQIDWAKKIPKRQHTVNDYGRYSSYYLTVAKDKLHFIFNDHVKNILDPEEGIYRSFKGGKSKHGAVAIASVNASGDVQRNLLYKTKEASSYLKPKFCSQSDPTTTILYGTVGRFKQFGKLKF